MSVILLETGSRVLQNISAFENREQAAITVPPVISAKGHQRSRTTFDLPPLFTRTPSVSPTRNPTSIQPRQKSREPSPNPWASSVSLKSDSQNTDAQRKAKASTVGKIASWFEGASEPVNISLVPSPKKEEPQPFYQLQHNETVAENRSSMDNLTQRPRKQNISNPNSANSSRFSFFKKTTTVQIKVDPDELIQLDIREALLPDGPVDEVTPATFKDLQLTAESLLRRFQLSYAENLGALRQITSERTRITDELDAAQMRNEHLKMQLLEMAEKASDQERVIASLKSQLAEPQSTVRMIQEDDEQYSSRKHSRRTRYSDVSSSGNSFVDSEMSSAVSIFSDAESIRTPATSVAASPTMRHASLHNTTVVHGTHMQPQVTPILVQHCQNCHNVPATEAWEVVEMMKMESAGLKQRIAELETAHDSALEFLATLRL